MDIGTLIGIVAGFGLVIYAMLMGGTLDMFINLPGLLIVVGGTVSATLISQAMSNALNAFKVAFHAFLDRTKSVEETTKIIHDLADRVRKEGLLAAENVQIDDYFLSKGMRLAVDGVSSEIIRETLTKELLSLRERHQMGQQIFRFMGTTAPAMGMIGTLVGLVQMLQALEDPSSIGPAMAVALLTTLYGALMANLIFNPLADKLNHRTLAETRNIKVIIEGIDSIVKGENAVIMKERLQAFLTPKEKQSSEPASEAA